MNRKRNFEVGAKTTVKHNDAPSVTFSCHFIAPESNHGFDRHAHVFDKEDALVGFIIGVPSLSVAMQKANGKLFPFGFYHIMKALKHPKVIDLFLTAVDPQLQGMGLPAILISELQQTIMEHGVTHVETTGMIETNQKAIQHWKNYDHIQHKRKRCFKKIFLC